MLREPTYEMASLQLEPACAPNNYAYAISVTTLVSIHGLVTDASCLQRVIHAGAPRHNLGGLLAIPLHAIKKCAMRGLKHVGTCTL